jgi:hypothetical protein
MMGTDRMKVGSGLLLAVFAGMVSSRAGDEGETLLEEV